VTAQTSTPIAVFVSAHGFGHAARACAVVEALAVRDPALRFEIFTEAPEWFFSDSLRTHFRYHTLRTDVGLVQTTSLREDLPATLEVLERFLPFDGAEVARVARQLEELGCAAALCDIAPFGIASAAAAGIPAVLIENFTWDWVYEHYAAAHPAFARFAALMHDVFVHADMRIQTTPVCRREPGAPLVAPVSRTPRTSAAAVRRRLGVPEGAAMVLLTMGGIPFRYDFLDHIARLPESTFFVVPGADKDAHPHPRCIGLPHRSGYHHPDLVAAADLVVGKLGYSTLAEAHAAAVRFAFVPRPTFPESAILARFAVSEMMGFAVGAQEFSSGTWLDRVPEMLAAPKPQPPAATGAADAARLIHERLVRQARAGSS